MAIRFPNPKKPTNANSSWPATSASSSLQALQGGAPPLSSELTTDTTLMTHTTPLSSYTGAYNTSKFYDWHGRIGRVQYFAYPMIFMAAALLVFMVAFLAFGGMASIATGAFQGAMSGTMLALAVPLVLSSMYIQFATSKRRFNDLNQSGWWSLLLLIPVLGYFVPFYLLLVRGNVGANKYGLPPAKPNRITVIVACILPLLVFAGFAVAIALPAYQSYVQKQAQLAAPTTTPPKITNQAVSSDAAVNDIGIASTVDVASQVASTPTHTATELNTQTIVITGDQLGNPAAKQGNETQTVANPRNPQTQSPMTDVVPPQPANNDNPSMANSDSVQRPTTQEATADRSITGSTGRQTTMSYEEFMKTSQQTVYVDR